MVPVRAWAVAAVAAAGVGIAGGQPPALPDPQPPVQPGFNPPAPPAWPQKIGDRDIKQWVADLNDPDPTIQEIAAKTLPQFGPDARRHALRPLIAKVSDSDPGVRVNAILAVGAIGVEDKEDVKLLVKQLRGCIDRTVAGSVIRIQAARALGAIGPDAHEAIPDLARLATDTAWETRGAAAEALGRVGQPVYDDKPGPDGQPVVKRPASKVAMDKLATVMLKDASATVRLEAVHALLMLGPPYTPNPDDYARVIQPYADAVAGRLRPYKAGDKDAGEKDEAVRVWLKLLGIMYDDRQYSAFLSQIGQATGDRNPVVRVHALRALAVLGPGAKPAFGQVRDALKDADPQIVAAAIGTAAAMREAGRPLIPDLELIRQSSKYDDLKKLAEAAIESLKPGKVEPPKKK
jgi:hypothetical protein